MWNLELLSKNVVPSEIQFEKRLFDFFGLDWTSDV